GGGGRGGSRRRFPGNTVAGEVPRELLPRLVGVLGVHHHHDRLVRGRLGGRRRKRQLLLLLLRLLLLPLPEKQFLDVAILRSVFRHRRQLAERRRLLLGQRVLRPAGA